MRTGLNDSIANIFVGDGTRPRSSRHRRTPDALGVGYEDVTFPTAHSDGVRLSGWLIPPLTPAPKGVLVLCHGHHSTRQSMLPKALCLRPHGFTTLLFDFRARGTSEGSACTLGLRETDDVLGAIEYLRGRPDTRSLPIGVLGESLGGASAILAAARSPEIGAVATEGTFASLEGVMVHRLKMCLGPFSATVADSCRRLGAEQFAIHVAAIAPEDAIAALSPRPFLLIQDALDLICPATQSDRLFAAAREPKTRWIVPGTPHTIAYWIARREYERRLSAFFLASLSQGG
jgi:fermentation-respiration switch protein FrsA (DUF1100 family)